MPRPFPVFDTEISVEYVGIAKLRQRMNTADLDDLRIPMLVVDNRGGRPVAVIFNYSQYLAFQKVMTDFMQPALRKLSAEILSNSDTK